MVSSDHTPVLAMVGMIEAEIPHRKILFQFGKRWLQLIMVGMNLSTCGKWVLWTGFVIFVMLIFVEGKNNVLFGKDKIFEIKSAL